MSFYRFCAFVRLIPAVVCFMCGALNGCQKRVPRRGGKCRMKESGGQSAKSFQYKEAKERRLKVGEVAELFGLNVQTLHYYDKIGLFCPRYREGASGYRFYDQTQLYRLANIIYLRKQGYSIEEIKNYLDHLTYQGRAAGLQTQAESLTKEVKRLEFISNAIKEKIRYIEQSDYRTFGTGVEIADVNERMYIEIGPEKDLYASEAFYFFPTVVIYTPQSKIFGACIRLKGDFFSYASLYTGVGTLEQNIKTFPKGHVLRSFHRGPYETISGRIVEMLTFGKSLNLHMADYSIHFNIIDQFVESDPEKYVTEIHIPLI